MKILGVDFTSLPSVRKPITAAIGRLAKNRLSVQEIVQIPTFEKFDALLNKSGPWIGGFDFPFGLPRDAIQEFGWPNKWEEMVLKCAAMGRKMFEDRLNQDRISRPTGEKYRYRKGDRLAGSSPAVRLHQVPVGKMFFEGAPRLALSDVHIPVLRQRDSNRIALEAYPGYLTKGMLGIKSYKSDEKKKQTPEKRRMRGKIVRALTDGNVLGLQLDAEQALLDTLVSDPTADQLDAVICAMQAAWGWTRRSENFGLPAQVDPIEGWIVTVSMQ